MPIECFEYLYQFAVISLVQGSLATALLEFFARPAWTRIVPSNLWHRAEEVRHVAKHVVGKALLGLEIAVNLRRCGRRSRNQRFPKIRANWIFMRSHPGIGVVLVS